MREVPELTFRGALSALGHYDRPVLDRLNSVLGGAIMMGGVVGLAGPAVAPVVGLAALWGWVDQKNEAVGLVRKLLDKIGDHRAAARGFDRTRLVAAAHTILVASSVVDAVRRAVGEKAFKGLEITDKELTTVLTATSDGERRTTEVMYDSVVPMPSSGCGYTENLADVLEWQQRFAAALLGFCRGLSAGQALPDVDAGLVGRDANRRYQDQYRRLAAQVPEFLVWALLNEFAASHELVANAHEEVRRALTDQVRAMFRLESLLTAVSGAAPDQVSALHRAARAGLEEPVVMRDATAMSILADIQFPLIREGFIPPDYRCERVDARSRIADEQWWRPQPRHHDLDLRLAAHLTSTGATRLPLLVLGHPGAGKSLLMKVLSARLPSDQYTTVYTPLRHVSSTAPVFKQVEQALALETNGRVDWASLVYQSKDTTLVVLLDGLDEMLQATDRDRAGYLDDVAEFQRREATQGRHVVAFVTSRTLVADRVDVPTGTTVVKLEDFDSGQVEQWRYVWNSVNRAAIEAGTIRALTAEAVTRQHELAQQPLLLLMLAVYSADPSFPAIESGLSKTALYRTLFDNFTRREAMKLPDADPSREQLERLSVAALGMFNRGRQYITDVELAADLTALATTADSHKHTDPDQRLVAQFFFVHTAEANLNTDRARRSYEFLHATFGEYLVAHEVVDTLVETADSAVGRRGAREPDDDRLFALLSHDSLATRGPVLDFIADLLAEQSPDDREQILQTTVTLLAGARRRQGSTRHDDYRPTGTDHVRAIAAYTANLVLLAILVEPLSGHRLPDLIGKANWRPTLDLWRAGLATDSWYALLAAIEREDTVLRLSDERTGSTGLDAELRQADLASDEEVMSTLEMGRTIRESVMNPHELLVLPAEYEELLGWLVTVLAFGGEPYDRPMHQDRVAELFDAIDDPDPDPDPDLVDAAANLRPLISMVLKQRASALSPEIAHELVAYLLREDSRDTYAFIAATAAHPGLLTEFPQLLKADRYEGMQGTELMLNGILAMKPSRLTLLLNSIKQKHNPTTEPEELSKAAAALLDAFQWNVEP